MPILLMEKLRHGEIKNDLSDSSKSVAELGFELRSSGLRFHGETKLFSLKHQTVMH